MSTKKINFTANGSTLVYSNNPEAIPRMLLRNTGYYTVKYPLPANKIVNFEFYHSNQSSGRLTFGVLLYNNSGKPVQYVVRRSSFRTQVSGDNVGNALECNRQFYQSSISSEIRTLNSAQNNNTTVFGILTEGNSTVNGKIELMAITSGITAYVVYYDSNFVSQYNITNFKRAADDGHNRTSAIFSLNHRATTSRINPVRDDEYLLFCSEGNGGDVTSSTALTHNYGEYPTSSSSNTAGKDGIGINGLAGGKSSSWLCLGNYAVVYDLNFIYAPGRKVRFTPTRGGVGLMMRSNGGIWYAYRIVAGDYKDVELNSLDQLSVILVGGGAGDIKMKIV